MECTSEFMAALWWLRYGWICDRMAHHVFYLSGPRAVPYMPSSSSLTTVPYGEDSLLSHEALMVTADNSQLKQKAYWQHLWYIVCYFFFLDMRCYHILYRRYVKAYFRRMSTFKQSWTKRIKSSECINKHLQFQQFPGYSHLHALNILWCLVLSLNHIVCHLQGIYHIPVSVVDSTVPWFNQLNPWNVFDVKQF